LNTASRVRRDRAARLLEDAARLGVVIGLEPLEQRAEHAGLARGQDRRERPGNVVFAALRPDEVVRGLAHRIVTELPAGRGGRGGAERPERPGGVGAHDLAATDQPVTRTRPSGSSVSAAASATSASTSLSAPTRSGTAGSASPPSLPSALAA
jgi:hypothetical protein